MVASPKDSQGDLPAKASPAPARANRHLRLRFRLATAFVLVNVLVPLSVHVAGVIIGGRII